jgi:membrane protease YdiL (CAAX protease family)
LHYGNSGINLLGLLNLFLFGVFAALYFLRRGSIWGISAIHSMWNFAQGNVFGCAVSGNSGMDSIFSTTSQSANTIFNGGAFGPEGGLGVTIILSIGIIILLPLKNKMVEVPMRKFGSEFYSA